MKIRNDGTYIKDVDVTYDANGNASVYKILRYTVSRDENGTPILDEEGNLIYIDSDAIDGRAIIEQKFEMCRSYMLDYFGIDVDELRREVLSRMYVTDVAGEPVQDEGGNYQNRLLMPTVSDPSQTVIDSLRYQVKRFESMQVD